MDIKFLLATGHEIFDRTEWSRRFTMSRYARTQTDTLGLSKRSQCDSAIAIKGTKVEKCQRLSK